MPMLTRRAAVLVAMEGAYDTLPSFNPATDALLIENPNYTANITMLDRKFLHPSLSTTRHKAGMKTAKLNFTTELTTNGRSNSGMAADAPVLARLLRACGMKQTAMASPTVLGTVFPQNPVSGAPNVTWSAPSGAVTVTETIAYNLIVTTGGPSGSALMTVVANDPALDITQTNVSVTSGAPINVGSKGIVTTPSFTGSLIAGQAWTVFAFPAGTFYSPISSNFESVSLQFFVDGSVHTLTGCYGTFQIKADAGNYASITFDMMGRFLPYVDSALPNAVFTQVDPPVFERATLALGAFQPIIKSLTVDYGITITPRDSANAQDGYFGMLITDRASKGGLDPEAVNASQHNLWADYSQATASPLVGRIGTVPGTRISFGMPTAQMSGLTYQDRNNIRAHQIGLTFSRYLEDDELFIALT